MQVSMHLVHPHHRSLLPSTVLNALTLFNIIQVHAGGCALSISAKPGSAIHFSTSTSSTGLQCLSVGACMHLVWFRAVSHNVWLLLRANIFCTSQLLASLGGCQLEPLSPKRECKFASVVTHVFKCCCGNEGREPRALVPLFFFVV